MKRSTLPITTLLTALALVGCAGPSTSEGAPGGGFGPPRLGPLPLVTKVDLLLVIDNSRSMADKQMFLSAGVRELLARLTDPPCLDETHAPISVQPASPYEPCPLGSARELAPVTDMHIGVISTSLGGHGADACAGPSFGNFIGNNDAGHLLARLDPQGAPTAPTYQDQGFLVWDPAGKHNPAGESDIDALGQTLSDIVLGVGQVGCGFESQLESWYRFLVDPEPYATIPVIDDKAVPTGIDTVLLEQRAAFLRPDSLLAIVMLSDENDCSIREGGQYFFAAQLNASEGVAYHLPAGRAICQTDPTSPCCRSCGQSPGFDELGAPCPDDPSCGDLDQLTDDTNLRCFDQKRRFGIDFLYPIDRYVDALTLPTIANRQGQLVPNPIFSDLNPNDDVWQVRDPGLVVLAGIVGVPWQDVARDPTDASHGNKTFAELSEPTPAGPTTWEIIVGEPSAYVAPIEPHMIESIEPRSGQNPILGTPLAPPGSPPWADPISGSEYTNLARDELQFACIFPLITPRKCQNGTGEIACDCSYWGNDSPLCAPNPDDGGLPTLQVNAKSYPGIRELDVLRQLGDQGVVSSICPGQVVDSSRLDFGYRVPMQALVDRMKGRL